MLANHIHALPGFEHHILWPQSNNHLVAETPGATLHPMPAGPGRQLAAIRRLTKRLGPALVWAHSSAAGLYTRILPRRAPVVYEPHGWAMNYPHWSTLKRLAVRTAERLLAARSAAAAVLTRADAQTARDLGIRHVTVVPSVSHAATTTVPGPAPTVVMAGRVTPVKDPQFFADVTRRVRDRIPACRFVWIGGGEPDLTETLLDAGAEVTGWVGHQQVWDQMGAAHLYVHTSTSEGFPVTVVDAATIGLPLLLRRIPAFDAIPGPHPETAADMADRIIGFFLDNDQRPAATAAHVRHTTGEGPHVDALRRLLDRAAPNLARELDPAPHTIPA